MNNNRFKFRVWDKENKVLHYNAECAYDSMGGTPPLKDDSFGGVLCNEDYVVEQCTGLKDKNGNLIYEGDIISRGNGNQKKILFYQGGFGWWSECGWFVSFSGHNYLGRILQTHEIIGNIHEEGENDKLNKTF